MSVLTQKLKAPLVRALAAFAGPRMVYGWSNPDGSWCASTALQCVCGSMTF